MKRLYIIMCMLLVSLCGLTTGAYAAADGQVATPTITFSGNKATMACTTTGARIYYTTDGSDPTADSPYYGGTPITLYGNYTVRAIAVCEGYADSPVAQATLDYYKVETPVISITGGERCTITCSTAGSRIYYRIVDSPNVPFDRADATLYENMIVLTDNCFVQAVAERDMYNPSDVAVQGVYTYGNAVSINSLSLTGEECDDLVITLANRTPFSAIQMVVGLPSGLKLHGDMPVELATERKADHTMGWHQTADGQVKVIVYSTTNSNLAGSDGTLLTLHVECDNAAAAGQKAITVSDVVCATAEGVDYFLDNATSTFTQNGYTQTVATPVIRVNGDHVSISSTTAGATIYYTLDGSYPNTATAQRYTSMFVLEGNATIRAIATCEGMNMSAMAEATVSSLRVATPVLKMQTYDSFTLNTATRGAQIRYTLDGSEPTQQSTLYTGVVTLTQNCTVRAKAFRSGWIDSPVLTRSIQSLGQYVYADKVYATLGSDEGATVTVRALTHEQYSAYQLDVTLPAGLALEGDITGRHDTHTLQYHRQPSGAYRVLAYNTTGAKLPEGDIALFDMHVVPTASAVAGDVEIGLGQIVFSQPDGSGIELGASNIEVSLSAQSLHMAQEDYSILASFCTAMDGSHWTDLWNTSSDMIVEESWPGVTFEDGHVVAIDLQDQGLTGTLPTAIFGLPYLRSLNLSGNHISGCVDQLMADVNNTTLEELNLSGNELTGDVYALAQALPQLNTLLVGSNRMATVSHALPQTITQLDLSYQTISTDIRGTLRQLQTSQRGEMPSIVTYNHVQQNFLGLNLALSNADANWGATMKYGATQLSCAFSGRVNEYNGEQGDEVQMRSLNTLSYGTTFVCQIDYEPGDATFDDMVNTQDLTTVINYMGGKYPTKNALFNRSASNLYADSRINVQDVVLMVDIILGQPVGANRVRGVVDDEPQALPAVGRLYVEDGALVLDTEVPIAALTLQVDGIKGSQLFWCIGDYGFSASTRDVNGSARAVVYSIAGSELPAGRTTLAYLRGSHQDVQVSAAEATDGQAALVGLAAQDNLTGIAPCPTHDATGPMYNLHGQRVSNNYKGIIIKNGVKYAGKH